jgi:hypothetical protein
VQLSRIIMSPWSPSAVKLDTPSPEASTIQNVLGPSPLNELIELALIEADSPLLNRGLPPLLTNIRTVCRHSFLIEKL